MDQFAVFNKIRELLEEGGTSFRVVDHEPTFTSEESARARGESLEIGAKAIVLKVNRQFSVFVLSAADRLDTKMIRSVFRSLGKSGKKIRFATAPELLELTDLVPGAVPPFGKPVFDLPLYVDAHLLSMPKIAFNAGSLTRSIVMPTDAYVTIANPMVAHFAVRQSL